MKAQSSEGCATAQKNPAKVAVKPWEVADRPWKRIHVDFAGPINGNIGGCSFKVSRSAAYVANYNRADHRIIEDHNGTQFTATEFTIFCAQNGIRRVTSAWYHVQSNGQVERFIDTFKPALKQSENHRPPQKDRLREFLMTYPHMSTKLTLSAMFLKRRISTVFDLMFPRGSENLKEQKRKMENTSGNRADRQFKISKTVMVSDYTRDQKLWREGVIVGQQGQVT
ncbi:Uncharacterized protein T4C_12685 [Trichinella pseudospiralis]|uniref:Integrase catalytic domain-containing protein n=1 Tax=Trichinella pseudospiralis TaxID=6337 RepID=A0A0V1JW54_TRIPS|nr:Uncharacterized protein T4C_12685 [Trichinella pseudospiralis]